MAQRHGELTDAGARVAGISVDDVGQQAAMVAKLDLPFPLLSDPDGSGAIRPYDLWSEERGGIARPAIVLVTPDREEAFRWSSRDYADRPPEDDVVARLRDLDLPTTSQDPPAPGEPRPGEKAMPVEHLHPYFRGAKFAAKAMGARHPQARDDADAYLAQMDRYLEAVLTLPR